MSQEFRYRLITSLVLAPLFIVLVVIGKIPFLVMVLVSTLIAYHEIHYMIEQTAFNPARLLGYLAAGLLVLSMYLKLETMTFGLTLLILSSLFWARTSHSFTPNFLGNVATTLLAVFYTGGLLGHVVLLRELPHGLEWMLLVLFGTWSADIGAYFVGKRWGRHKLIPTISPGKTREGAIGGSLISFGLVMGTALAFGLPLAPTLGIALLTPPAAILGDITMSAFKRSAGVKDAGKLIPGHGGLLDRIDSMLFTMPVAYYYILLVRFIQG